MGLAITIGLLLLAVTAVVALAWVAKIDDDQQCWRCGKELSSADEWHLDLTRLPGRVFCGKCWATTVGKSER